MNATGSKMLKESRFYQFGPFRLYPDERTLLREGQPIQLTDRAFDLLAFLVKNHGHLQRKDQIILSVWPDAHVGDGNLHTQIKTLRDILGADCIETVAKHGYRFIAEVTEGSEKPDQFSSRQGNWKFRVAAAVTLPLAGVLGIYAFIHRKPAPAHPQERPSVTLYERALQYERGGDDEQALAAIDQALSIDPNYSEACVRAAYLSYELENDSKAIAYLQQCKGAATRPDALGLKAQALTRLLADDSVGAMELYQLLIDRYPDDADGLFRFAEVATDLDRIQEADRAAMRCLALEPESPYCHFQLMYVRIKENRFTDVASDYKSLPASIREYPWFDEPVGVALFGNGQLDEAIAAFERLGREQPKLHGSSHFTTGKEWLADVDLYKGRIEEGTQRIRQIMETSDNASSRGGYLVYLAQIYALVGDTKAAQKLALETASSPGEPADLTDAAIVLAIIGDDSGTELLLNARSKATTAALDPGYDHLMRGLLAIHRSKMKDGIEELRLARELKPKDEEIAYQLATAYLQSGDYRNALTTLEGLQDLKGKVLLDGVPFLLPLSSYRIGQCYDQLGQPEAAKPYYSEAAKSWSGADKAVHTRFPIPPSLFR